MRDEGDITLLLRRAAAGDGEAFEAAIGLVHRELERIARGQARRAYGERAGTATLEPAALVNETFLKLAKRPKPYENRAHFYAVATKVMLRVLIDHERARDADKRGGDRVQVSLTGLAASASTTLTTATALAEALDRLEALDAAKAEVVRLRLIWEMPMAEIAQVTGLSLATVERHWRFSRAWLKRAFAPAR